VQKKKLNKKKSCTKKLNKKNLVEKKLNNKTNRVEKKIKKKSCRKKIKQKKSCRKKLNKKINSAVSAHLFFVIFLLMVSADAGLPVIKLFGSQSGAEGSQGS